ncbi:MAG: hypothetical protein KDJ80_15050 [Nitratireductor sp.]|nr:hypothetical protein [Nitratireductor sp.]
MHILLGMIGIVAAASYYFFVLKNAGKAANEAADMAMRVRGRIRRNAFRKKAEASVLSSVDDPLHAAAIVLLAIATEEQGVAPHLEEGVARQIAEIADGEKVEETLIFAKWALDQNITVPTVIDRLSETLEHRLNEAEKEQLCRMALAATPPPDRGPYFTLRMERLRRKLGLIVE